MPGLYKQIEKACPDKPFDGYFVFDADNLPDETIYEMNKSFSQGHRITSCRNSKNYGSNYFCRVCIMVSTGIPISNCPEHCLGSCAVSVASFYSTGYIRNQDEILPATEDENQYTQYNKR